jgi:hypothetical protein
MNYELGKKMAWAGVALYLVILVFQLYYFFFDVGFVLLPLIGILLQIGFGLPVVMALQKKIELPLYDYAKGLALMVSVLAVSGYLGLPEAAIRMADDGKSAQKAALAIREDLGEYEKLDLEVDLAAATTEDEKKKVREEIEKLGKSISDKDREAYQRDLAVVQAKRERDEWGREVRRIGLGRAYLDNGLIVMGAFLILLGACVMSRPEPKPAA